MITRITLRFCHKNAINSWYFIWYKWIYLWLNTYIKVCFTVCIRCQRESIFTLRELRQFCRNAFSLRESRPDPSRPGLKIFSPTPSRFRGIPAGPFWGSSSDYNWMQMNYTNVWSHNCLWNLKLRNFLLNNFEIRNHDSIKQKYR